MNFEKRIALLVKLGETIGKVLESTSNLTSNELVLKALIQSSVGKNQWFTPKNVTKVLTELTASLKEDALIEWTSKCIEDIKNKKNIFKVGIVMAGNIPLVGFHDLLCVFVAGDQARIKLSSDDQQLLPALIQLMSDIDADLVNYIKIEEGYLKGVDRVIATGSNNTSRYFDYYFRNIPRIIRKSRTSIAVLESGDDAEVFSQLSEDVFTYFGLGCRSVSKIFIPKEFDLTNFITELRKTKDIEDHQKYLNNLEYHKSVLLINNTPFLDGGFFLLKEDEGLFSPISVLYYQRYQDILEVDQYIKEHQEDIQCVVNSRNRYGVLTGESQSPKLWDYADGMDVMQFLLKS